jgi:hypothetical protein
MKASPRAAAPPALPAVTIRQKQRGFTTHQAKANIVELNRSGVTGLVGAFFEDAVAAPTGAVRPDEQIGEGTFPDLDLVGYRTLMEVKATGPDPMRYSLTQLADYLRHGEDSGHDVLYWFVWYDGIDENGRRSTLASMGGERGTHAVARLHKHLIQNTKQVLVLDARIVEGIASRLRDEIGSCGYPGKTGKVGRILRTTVEAAFTGDPEGKGIVADFAPEPTGWRRLTGELPLGSYGEMFAAQGALRAVPAVAIVGAEHSERLLRNAGPLSSIFPERQLPKKPYRPRSTLDPTNAPF